MGAVNAPLLTALQYSVLALGDRQYQHFCGFGRALDDWLARAGAIREHARLEVDNSDTQALAAWRAQVGGSAPRRQHRRPSPGPGDWKRAS